MNIKALTAGMILTGAVATPIALTISSSTGAYETNPYAVTISNTASYKTLNKFKAPTLNDIDPILGTYTTALIKTRPTGKNNGGLETALSVGKLGFDFGTMTPEQKAMLLGNDSTKRDQMAQALTKDMTQYKYSYNGLTGDLAEWTHPLGAPNNSQGVAFQLRDSARFWNGDRVTAEDFIETYKVALNAKNGVPWAWQIYRTMGLSNAKKIWDAQTVDGLSFEAALEKYPLGIIASEEIKLEDMATTPEGKAYYAAEYAAGRKRHKKLIFLFDGNLTLTFLTTYALNTLSTPTNIRHFDKVGLDDWGTSVENLMGCGPYKLAYFDLDYKIVTNRWEGYWDHGRVISPQIELRVLPDISTQIQMFKDGKTGTVSFGAALLPQFFSDPELKRFIKPTNWAENLTYLGFNTTPDNPNSKYLLNENLRRAVQYSIDRRRFLRMIGADNTFPTESWTTLSSMTDAQGAGPISHSIDFKNDLNFLKAPMTHDGSHIEEWNHLYKTDDNDPMAVNADGKDDMFKRDEAVLTSLDQGKNDKTDYIYNPKLAKAYYAQFKKENPTFTGVELKWLVPGAKKDEVLTIKQNIEENLPGVTIKIIPKPDLVYEQVKAKMDWDMCYSSWGYDYREPWTFYHLVADKVTKTDDTDPIIRARMNNNISSEGLSLVDYIAQKQFTDPKYFAKRFLNNDSQGHQDVMNSILAQFLRMEATVGSENPEMNSHQSPVDSSESITGYDDIIWDTEPKKENEFNGYKGAFDKYEKIYNGASHWHEKLKQFIADHSDKDLWKNKDYRFRVLYPTIERLIRDSAIGVPISRIQNNFIISRLIGQINFADRLYYFGYVYQTNKIPPSNFVLPGKEAISA